nr:putative porin [Dawidia cretensis]
MLSLVTSRINRIKPHKSFKNLFLRVQFWRYTLFLGFLVLALTAAGQDEDTSPRRGSRIIDDTTRQVYGPKSSRYYYEEDVFLNKQTYHLIDTAIRGFYRYTYLQKNENLYQDLGNIGTAMHPIYYQTPASIGVSSGFTQYDLVWDTEKIRYFDTKSPYSNMWVMLGGGGRSLTKASYSRNINPRWNFGFDYRGLFIDKQIQRQGKGDRQVRGVYYDLYTAYQSKDSTYRLFANFQRNRHQTDENGGIVHTDNTDYEGYFQTNVRTYLTEAASTEVRINLHLFHEYEIGKALQVYHVFDRFRQGNVFTDLTDNFTQDYYDYVTIENDTVDDRSKFKTVRNELGLKGNLAKLFYNGYYAIRNYSQTYSLDTAHWHRGTEHYLGGRMALRLDSIGELSGWVEVLQTGNYRVEGHLKSEWFEASVKQMQYAPSFIQQGYFGSHDDWDNNSFSNVNVTEFSGSLHYNSRVFSISPGLTFTSLTNYVYFRKDPSLTAVEQLVTPRQSQSGQTWVSPEVRLSLTMLRHVYLRGRAIYTTILKDEDKAIRVPELFVNGELSYENIFFNGNLDMQAGVNVHWNSAYRALGYDVPTQQFYVQNSLKIGSNTDGIVPSFPLVEVFFATRIKRGRIFLKYHNLVQMITKQGYMPTPYYRGQGSILDFGFDWSFYD